MEWKEVRLANGGTREFEIAVPLKYVTNFWRNLEMSLVNCEINLNLICSEDCVISSTTGVIEFAITDAKLYVPIVTLPTQDNVKLL